MNACRDVDWGQYHFVALYYCPSACAWKEISGFERGLDFHLKGLFFPYLRSYWTKVWSEIWIRIQISWEYCVKTAVKFISYFYFARLFVLPSFSSDSSKDMKCLRVRSSSLALFQERDNRKKSFGNDSIPPLSRSHSHLDHDSTIRHSRNLYCERAPASFILEQE